MSSRANKRKKTEEDEDVFGTAEKKARVRTISDGSKSAHKKVSYQTMMEDDDSEAKEEQDMDDDEEHDVDAQSNLMAKVTKSGRVRKKSAKVLEMEEVEELEKKQLKKGDISRPTPKKSKSKPLMEDAGMAIVGSIPKAQDFSITATGAVAKKPKFISTYKSPQKDVTMLKIPTVLRKIPPSGTGETDSLKMKLSLVPPAPAVPDVEVVDVKPGKKQKIKKEKEDISVPLPLEIPDFSHKVSDSGSGLKLKLVLSPKESSAVAVVGSPESPASKSSKKKSKRSDGEGLFAELSPQKLALDLSPSSEKEKMPKKKKKKKDTDHEKPDLPKPDIAAASLHLLAALSQAMPKNPALLSPSKTKTSPQAGGGTLSPMSSPLTKVKEDAGEGIKGLATHHHKPSGKKKKSKKLKSKGSEDKSGDVAAAAPNVLSSPKSQLPVYADTNRMAMKLKTSAEKKASKKTKKGADGEGKKRKRRRGYTAYMLWCNSYRGRVIAENPGIDFAQMSKRLGEIWQGLLEKEKMSWKRKAKKLNAKGSTLISTGKAGTKGAAPPITGPTVSASVLNKAGGLSARGNQPGVLNVRTPHRAGVNTAVAAFVEKSIAQADEVTLSDCGATDVAAHLRLLGESLSIIGSRLQEHQGQIAVQGSLSVLLDSMLCALGPLMCLTTHVPELNGCPIATHAKSLDNIAYIMPGIG